MSLINFSQRLAPGDEVLTVLFAPNYVVSYQGVVKVGRLPSLGQLAFRGGYNLIVRLNKASRAALEE